MFIVIVIVGIAAVLYNKREKVAEVIELVKDLRKLQMDQKLLATRPLTATYDIARDAIATMNEINKIRH